MHAFTEFDNYTHDIITNRTLCTSLLNSSVTFNDDSLTKVASS